MTDLSLQLLRHGYDALPREWARAEPGAQYVETRLLGHRAHVVRGEEGARLFSVASVVSRSGAQHEAISIAKLAILIIKA